MCSTGTDIALAAKEQLDSMISPLEKPVRSLHLALDFDLGKNSREEDMMDPLFAGKVDGFIWVRSLLGDDFTRR